MVVANDQVATIFPNRNTSTLQGCLEPTEVVPYPYPLFVTRINTPEKMPIQKEFIGVDQSSP